MENEPKQMSARVSLTKFILSVIEAWLNLWDLLHALVVKVLPHGTASKTVTNTSIFAVFATGLFAFTNPTVEFGVGKSFDYRDNSHHTIVAYYNGQVTRNQRYAELYFTEEWAIRYQRYLKSAADFYNIDEAILYGLMVVESGLNRKAVSPRGARGLLQIILSHHPEAMKKAADFCNADKYDPDNACHSIFAGADIFDEYLDLANGSVPDALLYYNRGPNARDFKNLRNDRIADGYFLQRPYMEPGAEYRDFPLKVMANALAYKSYQKFGKVLALQTRADYEKFFDEISLKELLVDSSHKSFAKIW